MDLPKPEQRRAPGFIDIEVLHQVIDGMMKMGITTVNVFDMKAIEAFASDTESDPYEHRLYSGIRVIDAYEEGSPSRG